jgi:hypothetical protein
MGSVDSRYVRESTLEILILRSSWNGARGSYSDTVVPAAGVTQPIIKPAEQRETPCQFQDRPTVRSELAAHEGSQRFSWKI